MTNETLPGNRELADLLPWYATDRLGAADRTRVAAALESDAALREELRLVREEMSETVAFNEALGTPSRAANERFFAALDADPRGKRLDLMHRVADWMMALGPRPLAIGTCALAALVVVQGATISYFALSSHRGSSYGTASVHQTGDATGPALLVSFAPSAPVGAIGKLLEAKGLTIVAGPSAGFYSLRPETGASPTKLSELASELRRHTDVVRSVMLQSPPD
jgi:hypothetical protein